MSIDIEQHQEVVQYLIDHELISAEAPVQSKVLKGGVSNRAVVINIDGEDRWVIKQALNKLRVAVDWFSSPERIHREAAGLRALFRLLPEGSIPEFVFEDPADHILIMQAIPQPHHNWKSLLLKGEVNQDHVHSFATLLASMHCAAHQDGNTLSTVFSDRHFFHSLRIEPYYEYSAQQVPDAHHFIHELARSTEDHLLTLVHGDYSPKNIIVYDNRLVLLDHEVIHWGDPAFDVGFSMTHLLSKAHHLNAHRDSFQHASETYWRTYHDALIVSFGVDYERRCVRHTLGCLLARVAGRSQLEYLSDKKKSLQKAVVLKLINNTPDTMPELIHRFIEEIEDNAFN